MATRAKFKCQSVTRTKSGTKEYQEVKLSAVYGGDKNSEDNQFSEATPSGTLIMVISNPAVLGFFEPDKNYYLDITTAP